MSFNSLGGAAKAMTRLGAGAVRRLDLSASTDLECRNLMCEKLGEACACKLARFVQQSQKGLEELEVLDISHSKLKVLPTAVFECLPSLRELRMTDNGLKVLPKEVGLLSKLRVLDVSNNQIETIPVEELEALEDLEAIHLSGNPQTTLDTVANNHILKYKMKLDR